MFVTICEIWSMVLLILNFSIAGYSKAMEMYKSNKQLYQLSNILYFTIHMGKTFGTAEDKDGAGTSTFSIIPVLDALGEILDEMKLDDKEDRIKDAFGNVLKIRHVSYLSNGNRERMYSILYEPADHNAYETCKNLVKIGQQYSDFIGGFQVGSSIKGYGNNYSFSVKEKLLKNYTLVKTNEICSLCKEDSCRLALTWEYERIFVGN